MLTRAQKEEQVAELKEKFSQAKSVYVADYRGLQVQEADELRRRVRSEGAGEFEYRVAKNSVLKRASAGSDVEGIISHLEGPTAIAFTDDPAAPARIIKKFASSVDAGKPQLKAAIVDGSVFGSDQLETLVSLKSKDELISDIIGLLLSPSTNVVGALQSPGSNLVGAIKAIADKAEA